MTAGIEDGGVDPLLAYAPRVATEWLVDSPGIAFRRLDGAALFVDVSGFTALTERLAARGRIGAEQITDVIATAFGTLLEIAGRFGADLLKWGGDAALLWFAGSDGVFGATRAALLMTDAMRRVGRVPAPGGAVRLQVSIGIHAGEFDFYLVGEEHRELIVTGDGVTELIAMETAASGGEIVISHSTARRLPRAALGPAKGSGVLLVGTPDELGRPTSPGSRGTADRPGDRPFLLPAPTRRRVLEGGEPAEHRQAAIAFVGVAGVGDLAERVGPDGVAEALAQLIDDVIRIATRHGVSFHGTDIAPDGTKLILLGGVPVSVGEDADRLIRAARDIVAAASARAGLNVRIGGNAGRTFVFDGAIGPGLRRIYSLAGDAVNLAARVMGLSSPGEVLVTTELLERTRRTFELIPLAPIQVKGKVEPVSTFRVGADRSDAPPLEHESAFVGRHDELARLLDVADRAAKGAGETVEITGDPGIGKSRLVAEASLAWPLVTWSVKAETYDRALPYSAMRRLLRGILGLALSADRESAGSRLREIVQQFAPDLAPWLPLLADVVDAEAESTQAVDALDPRYRLARLESAIVRLLGSLLLEPVAFVFEDVASVDAASLALIAALHEARSRQAWLIVLVGSPRRDANASEAFAGTHVFVLAPLDHAAARRLVVDFASGSTRLTPSELDALVARGAGNALFLRELADAALTSGSIEGLPDSLEVLLAAQIDSLAHEDRRVLRASAVLGSFVDEQLLAEVVDVGTVVDDLVWRRLAGFVAGEAGDRRFIHGLVRDAAYEGLAFRRRRELHARAAVAIESHRDPAGSAELLSLHWLEAENFPNAWNYAQIAGEHAAAIYANEEASLCFRRAMRAGSRLRPRPSVQLARVAEALGDVSELAGSYEQARAAYADARRIAKLPIDRARLLRKNGVLHERSGNYAAALRSYALGIGLVRGTADDLGTERCELDIAYAGVLLRQGRPSRCAQLATRVIDAADRLDYRRGLAHALYLTHLASVYLADPRDDLGERAVAIFDELGDPVGEGNALNNLGVGAYFRGEWDVALGHYRASRAVRDRCGDVVGAATEDNNIGEILSDQGHLDAARPLFEAARETWTLARYRIGIALATSNLGRIAVRAGQLDEGRELLMAALANFTDIGATAYVLDTRFRLLERDVAADASSAAASARGLLADLAPRPDAGILRAGVHRLLGVVLGRSGEIDEAMNEFGRALEIARSLSATFELAATFEARSIVSGDANDRERAAELWGPLGVVLEASQVADAS